MTRREAECQSTSGEEGPLRDPSPIGRVGRNSRAHLRVAEVVDSRDPAEIKRLIKPLSLQSRISAVAGSSVVVLGRPGRKAPTRLDRGVPRLE
jgi:hypothetical protein